MSQSCIVKSLRIFVLAVAALPLAGCLFHSHNVEKIRMSTAALQTATKEELMQRLAYQASQIQTLNATVSIAPSVGGAKRGKVTDYTNIKGYILVLKPAMLRMIGLFPVLGNRAFDMVSNGQEFRVSIPPKNKFIVGLNNLTYPGQKGLESLRPQHIFDALLLRPVDAADEIGVLEQGMQQVEDEKGKRNVEEPDYVLDIVAKDSNAGWQLSRKVYFSREDLRPTRQVLFDKEGNLATDAHYQKYQDFNGIEFPTEIGIDRPQDEYSITLHVSSARFNIPMKMTQFNLRQPPGSQLVRLDIPPPKNSTPAAEAPKPGPKPGASNPAATAATNLSAVLP